MPGPVCARPRLLLYHFGRTFWAQGGFCSLCCSCTLYLPPPPPAPLPPRHVLPVSVAGKAEPVAPVAYQVILEPGIGQFREFESPRVQHSYKFVRTFSCAQIDLRIAREGELATHDEKSTSSGIAELYAR